MSVVETWGHCLTLYYSNLWDCCRRRKIDPSAYGKLFVEVQSQAMTPFLATWLVSLVKSKKLGLWIDSTVFAFHSKLEELLIGAILTPDQKTIRDMIQSSRYGTAPKLKERKKRNRK